MGRHTETQTLPTCSKAHEQTSQGCWPQEGSDTDAGLRMATPLFSFFERIPGKVKNPGDYGPNPQLAGAQTKAHRAQEPTVSSDTGIALQRHAEMRQAGLSSYTRDQWAVLRERATLGWGQGQLLRTTLLEAQEVSALVLRGRSGEDAHRRWVFLPRTMAQLSVCWSVFRIPQEYLKTPLGWT